MKKKNLLHDVILQWLKRHLSAKLCFLIADLVMLFIILCNEETIFFTS